MPRRSKSDALDPPSAGAAEQLSPSAQLTRDRIQQAARELVLEEGANRLTLDAVVARAGLSKGAFLYHFKTKRDLLIALMDDMMRGLDAAQADHERRFAGDPDPWLSSQVASMPDEQMQRMGAALLAGGSEDPTLLEPFRDWYRKQYERVRTSPRSMEVAAIIMLALDGAFFDDMLGVTTLDASERRHLLRTLQALAAGDLELVPARRKP